MTTIKFLGAAETVTGSRFLIESEQDRVLVDAGLFQGTKDIRSRNWDPFPVDPATISALVLTHAHLDHCGYLPLLVKQGFSGPILATPYTCRLAEVILRDSARIQVEDAKFAQKKGFSKHHPPLPLYDEEDVEQALTLFTEIDFRTTHDFANESRVTFCPSGHILGSSFVVVEVANKRLLFTGDMGRPEHPVLSPPDAVPPASYDAVITESTYGDRIHVGANDKFAETIRRTVERGGSVLIPAFAVDRTEVILFQLRELMAAGEIPRVPVFADSPMALTSLDFYREAIREADASIRSDISREWDHQDPFDPGTLKELRSVDESKSLNNQHAPCIIVSASGMATGGRVVHHLARMLPRVNNTVILPGFQAVGTRGRSLEQGDEEVKIHGEWVPVRAEVVKIETFSVHADADELVHWLKDAGKPNTAFVVHGETGAAESFASRLTYELQWNAVVPKPGQEFTL